ncbi:MAG: T9SS type A sorting domain-containing protein [Bacteroidales bacterium]|nr:T9SS type A sorting domain-containing protein [Bacteroidales bacterium]
MDTLISVPLKDGINNYHFDLSFSPDSVIYNPFFRLISPVKREKMQILDNVPDFLIFPNPTNEYLNVVCVEGFIQKIRVFDVSGKLILNIETDNDSYSTQISTASLSKGIYFVEIQNNKKEKLSKYFIKH